MSFKTIDGSLMRDMLLSGCAYLNKLRETVDALNVFPVPDGDTGTNMSQTMNAAVKDVASGHSTSASEVISVAAKGALRGARGNSGVILSQILRGFAMAVDGYDEIDTELLAKAFKSGAAMAYKAVMKPKEGTILTVARAMAEAAENYARVYTDVDIMFGQVLKSGEEMLKRTPEMLPVLKQAGVVDSGGKGLVVIYTGFNAVLTGDYVENGELEAEPVSPMEYEDDHSALEDITFGYCTEFIVSRPREDMTNADVTRLRRRLERIGDCVFVVSDMTVVKVHVHTNDPGKALQMALELGELDSIKIDNMLEEHRQVAQRKEAEKKQQPMKEYGIVAVALGSGFTEIFKGLNVEAVVDGGQTMNPSIEDLQKAIESTNAKNVYVLPNNTNIILAAQQAAELTEQNVMVLPTKSVPMGISAALAFTSDADVQTNLEEMTAAAESVHTASITYSVRDTVFNDMEIHEGDIMGMIDNQISELGDDIHKVSMNLLDKMVTDDSAMITVYHGSDVDEETAQAFGAKIAEKFGACEVDVQNGGQPLYYYLIAVE